MKSVFNGIGLIYLSWIAGGFVAINLYLMGISIKFVNHWVLLLFILSFCASVITRNPKVSAITPTDKYVLGVLAAYLVAVGALHLVVSQFAAGNIGINKMTFGDLGISGVEYILNFAITMLSFLYLSEVFEVYKEKKSIVENTANIPH